MKRGGISFVKIVGRFSGNVSKKALTDGYILTNWRLELLNLTFQMLNIEIGRKIIAKTLGYLKYNAYLCSTKITRIIT